MAESGLKWPLCKAGPPLGTQSLGSQDERSDAASHLAHLQPSCTFRCFWGPASLFQPGQGDHLARYPGAITAAQLTQQAGGGEELAWIGPLHTQLDEGPETP